MQLLLSFIISKSWQIIRNVAPIQNTDRPVAQY